MGECYELSYRFPSDLGLTCLRQMSQLDHGYALWFVIWFYWRFLPKGMAINR